MTPAEVRALTLDEWSALVDYQRRYVEAQQKAQQV